MALVKFVTFVVLKILGNLVSMQNSLNANNLRRKLKLFNLCDISKTVQSNLTFILNILSEFRIHSIYLSIVIAKKNVGIFT